MSNDNEIAAPARAGETDGALLLRLTPHLTAIFLCFLIAGAALPVLPLHVEAHLGLGAFTVGLITGAQFIAAFLTRLWAGYYADAVSAKGAVLIGALVNAAGAAINYASLFFLDAPMVSAGVLLLGRAVLGAGESFVYTGALSWGLSLAGPARAGKVLSWLGVPLFLGMTVGAPIGAGVYALWGFGGVAIVCFLVCVVAAVAVLPGKDVPAPGYTPTPVWKLFGVVSLPALGVSLSTLGYTAVTIFITLYFAQRGWALGWAALTTTLVAFLIARIIFGPLPDKIGGARSSSIALAVQALGMFVIWLAPNPELVFVGAALTGAGYSIVFPALGLESVQRAGQHSRGMVMGAYTASIDLSLAFGTPALGAIASAAGTPAVFLASGAAALGALLVALKLMKNNAALAAGDAS